MRTSLIVPLLFIVLATGFVQPLDTQAKRLGDTAWGIVPVPNQDPSITAKGYFVYPMQPDARVSGQVLLRNPGSTPVTIDLTAVTAETAQNGGSAFAVESGAVSGVASWIEISEPQVTIDPGTERTISFSVQAPPTVKPGQYLGGIAASEAPITAVADAGTMVALGAAVTINKRYIIAVQADIPGAWQASLSIPNVMVEDQPLGTVLGVQLRNDGDVFLKPSGSAVVTDAAGQQLITHAIKLGTFVPGTAITYPIRWPGQPLAGSYVVVVKLNYGEGKIVTYESTITVSAEVAQHAVEQANSVLNVPSNDVPPMAVAPVAAAIQPWMIYMLGAFLLLIIILLSLILLRSRPKHGAV